jgi:hypothetical protein
MTSLGGAGGKRIPSLRYGMTKENALRNDKGEYVKFSAGDLGAEG